MFSTLFALWQKVTLCRPHRKCVLVSDTVDGGPSSQACYGSTVARAMEQRGNASLTSNIIFPTCPLSAEMATLWPVFCNKSQLEKMRRHRALSSMIVCMMICISRCHGLGEEGQGIL